MQNNRIFPVFCGLVVKSHASIKKMHSFFLFSGIIFNKSASEYATWRNSIFAAAISADDFNE